MNLLISEVLPADAVLDRVLPWMAGLFDDFAPPEIEDESREHEGRIVSCPEPFWYDLRLATLRQAILDAY